MRRVLATVLFDQFELLDVFGPLELFGVLRDDFELVMLGPTAAPVASAQGPRVVPDHAYGDAPAADIVLVPGGVGTRSLAGDSDFLSWLTRYADAAAYVTSVCTGSALLAAAGLLDGRRATSNKRSFAWVTQQGPQVDWVPQARWVVDGNRWTSSGVAAGMDMAIAIIAEVSGEETATRVADGVEYEPHRDPSWDPFAAKNGLA
ncbi:MAG: DJ-1/PfpI family protein [Acidimicrobiales bacterium]